MQANIIREWLEVEKAVNETGNDLTVENDQFIVKRCMELSLDPSVVDKWLRVQRQAKNMGVTVEIEGDQFVLKSREVLPNLDQVESYIRHRFRV